MSGWIIFALALDGIAVALLIIAGVITWQTHKLWQDFLRKQRGPNAETSDTNAD